MKKSELRKLVLEAMRGYSPQIGQTQGGTSNEFMQILTKLAKGDSEEEDQVARGHAVLDKANPDNVQRILRGEKPIYEGEMDTYTVSYWQNDDDWDFDVKASSPEEAIELVQAGKGNNQLQAPSRLARKFTAKKK